MKVRELIALLEDCDPEANVYIGHQPEYPFEYAVAGVAVRDEFQFDDELGTTFDGAVQCSNDVLIAEGRQVCYGDRDLWEYARKW